MKGKKEKTIIEAPDTTERYHALVALGKEIFIDSPAISKGKVGKSDVAAARRFMAEGITETSPEVWADYFSHIIIAPELGRRLATAMEKSGNPIAINEIEFLLWLHEAGRLITPNAYFRNDIVDDVLLKKIGLADNVTGDLPSLALLIKTAEEMDLSDAQVHKNGPLNKHQETIARDYFASMTPEQRLINLADNLGKRDENGLFTAESFLKYLRTQESRYEHHSQWPSVNWAIEHRQEGSILQAHVIGQTIDWLTKMGVDVDNILDSLANYGPKFVILVRHGNLDNSKNIVYNRDSLMDTDDVIHLSKSGIEQMQKLGNLIQRRKFRVRRILVSPETRTRESAKELNSGLQVTNDKVLDDIDIDEVRASGPYHEGLSMKQWQALKGNAYDETRWGRYNHEKPEEIIQRTNKRLLEEITELQTGHASIFVSHGDPIGFLINHLVSGKILYHDDKRSDLIYPLKGEGIVLIVGPDGKLFSYYTLTDESLPEGTSF